MTIFGYHASHEQLPPSRLLDCVQLAEQAGFQAAMCSDHFAPWTAAQGHSGFAWSWLGAALQATGLRFGCVTAPGQRYHPATARPGAHASAAAFSTVELLLAGLTLLGITGALPLARTVRGAARAAAR